jgi:hypothetical protein
MPRVIFLSIVEIIIFETDRAEFIADAGYVYNSSVWGEGGEEEISEQEMSNVVLGELGFDSCFCCLVGWDAHNSGVVD